jgi:GH15 family glucan-1,4-alpha-glucosidase
MRRPARSSRFRRFIQRASAGSGKQLQVLVAPGGKRRLTEITLDHLPSGHRLRPVRVRNAAEHQFQADMFGLLLELAGRWSERGNKPDECYWAFVVEAVDFAIANRERPRHRARDRTGRAVWLAGTHPALEPRDAIRAALEAHGIHPQRGNFVAVFDATDLDASLPLLADVGFVAYDNPRMLRTTEAIRRELDNGGLILRYNAGNGLHQRRLALYPGIGNQDA